MIFSVTELGTFMRCRRKALLSARNGRHLTPIFSPLSLNTGSIVHRAHQLWIEDPSTPLQVHALTASNECVDGVREKYLQAVGSNPSDAEMLVTHEAVEAALAICDNYYAHYNKQPLPPNYKLVAAEQSIRVQIPNTVHYLEGRLDALIEHVPTGRFDVLERKTYRNRPKHSDLQFNHQFLAYVWLVDKLNLTPHTPFLAYDGMWRRTVPPRGKALNDLFARYIITRAPHELEEFEQQLPFLVEEMASVYTNPHKAYPNRRWEGCYDCGFERLCASMSRGEDYNQIIRLEYAERTDDNNGTESDTNGTADTE